MGEVIGDGLIKLPFIASLQGGVSWREHPLVRGQGVHRLFHVPETIVAGLIDEVIDSGVTGIAVSDLLLLRKPFGGRRFDVVIDTQTNVRRSLVVKRARPRKPGMASSSRPPPISAFPTASRPPPGPMRWWIDCRPWRLWRPGGPSQRGQSS